MGKGFARQGDFVWRHDPVFGQPQAATKLELSFGGRDR